MIVKDEEQTLPECFESLHRLVDEVVVYDTGSSDGTVELAKRAGARVVPGYWDDDFARARNDSLQHCRGEWALWIDADERFVCPDIRQLRAALEAIDGTDALAVEIHNLGDSPDVNGTNVHRALRIFRRSRCRWYGALHEQVDLVPGAPAPLRVVPLKGARIDHIGYQPEIVKQRDKLARNLRLAEAALKHDVLPGQQGVPELNMARALAAVGRCEEAQSYFDAALERVGPGITTRATLLFSAQNLLQLGRPQAALDQATKLEGLCQQKGLAYYLEGAALRRLGEPAQAVERFELVEELSTEDGFVFPDTLLRAELAGALCEAGRPGEAADQLARLVEESPEVPNIRTALKLFAATGKSFEDLVTVMPENRLDKVAAALLLVPPVVADPVAESLYQRFGPRPQLLAAAIRFAPLVATSRALEWSARLRSIGMDEPCPLVAQARLDILEVPARVRAAVTAHAAFGDERGAALAVALAPGLPLVSIFTTLNDVNALDAPLLARFAAAVAGAGAAGAGPVGTPDERRVAVAGALQLLGQGELAAQIANGPQASGLGASLDAQLAALGADR